MLTISISEALQGPAAAAWSEWSAAEQEAWQLQTSSAAQWLEAGAAELQESLQHGMEYNPSESDAYHWCPWSADSSPHSWPQHDAEAAAASEAAAALAFAAAVATSTARAALAADDAASSSPKDAAYASPMLLPLPEPLAVEPLSQNLNFDLELHGLPESAAEPQKIASPPGLQDQKDTKSVKPSSKRDSRPSAAAVATGLLQTPLLPAPSAILEHSPPGITIRSTQAGSSSCTHVDWKIEDFCGKLQASMGRPVVSPAFTANGLSNLRLMVFPDARDAVKNARSHERKGLYTAMVKKGPLYGSLKLKADGLSKGTVMTFSLLVGGTRAGPTTYDFSEQAVQGLDDFGVDWLQHVEKPSGALHVGIEILEVKLK